MKRNIIAIAIVLGLFGCQNAKTNNESADVAEAKEMVMPSYQIQPQQKS